VGNISFSPSSSSLDMAVGNIFEVRQDFMFVGVVSGAVVAGGLYYAFSNSIQSQTLKSRAQLQSLSQQLQSPLPPTPQTVSNRQHVNQTFKGLLKQRWNEGLTTMFIRIHEWDRKVEDWGKSLIR